MKTNVKEQLTIRKISDFESNIRDIREHSFKKVSIFMKWKDSIEKMETKRQLLEAYLNMISSTSQSIHLDFRDNYLDDSYIPIFANFIKVEKNSIHINLWMNIFFAAFCKFNGTFLHWFFPSNISNIKGYQ